MLIIGAGGHALEVLEVIRDLNLVKELYFFDNISKKDTEKFYGYSILKDYQKVEELFNFDAEYIIGIGGSINRFYLANSLNAIGGKLISIISEKAIVSEKAFIGDGVNLMSFSAILGNAIINEGVLVNAFSSIHHDTEIGKYSELSPGCRILGGSKIGEFCEIGANAVILPKIKIADRVIVGAGSVVTKNLIEEGVYVGAPAIKIK